MSKAAGQTPPNKAKPRDPARDALFFLAMSVVTLALGIGLYLQFGLEFWLSAMAALAIYVALISLHALIRRMELTAELRREVSRLEGEMAELARGMPGPMPAGMGPGACVPGPRFAEGPVLVRPGVMQPSGPAGSMMPPQPGSATGAQRPVAGAGPMPDRAAPPHAPQPPARSGPPASLHPFAQQWPADARGAAPAGHPPAPKVPPDLEQVWSYRPARPPGLTEPQPAPSPPVLPQPVEPRTAAPQSARSGPPPLPTSATAPLPAVPAPEARPPTAASSRTGEADIDAIHGMIRRLADEIDVAPKPARPDDTAPELETARQIEETVDALKSTAEAMRARTEKPAAPGARTAPPPLPARPTQGALPPPLPQPETRPAPAPTPQSAATRPPLPARRSDNALDAEVASFASELSALDSPRAPPHIPGHLSAIASALHEGAVDVYLEPILGLADQRARHYEVSVRLRGPTGDTIDQPALAAAGGFGLLPLLDTERLKSMLAIGRRMEGRGKAGSILSQLAGESLSSDDFLNGFATTYQPGDTVASRLVFGFAQSDVRAFGAQQWGVLTEMAGLGFHFALEQVTDLDQDFEKLKGSGFNFVKLDASVFLNGLPADGGVVPASDLCRHLADLGLTLIVGAIANEMDLARVLGFGVLLGQGTMFGAPRPVKADVLRDREAAA